MLIGHGFVESGCDKNPKLRIEKKNNIYQVRVTVENPGHCRGTGWMRIWFLIDKPREPFEFSMQ
jgi:hypothetical protein